MKNTSKESTGIKDRLGQNIYVGDPLVLNYGTITLKGHAIKDADGEWELYKDKGNHISLSDNCELITKTNLPE